MKQEREESTDFGDAVEKQFRFAAKKRGLVIEGPLIADGQMQNVPCSGDPAGVKSGYYILEMQDGRPSGYLHNNRMREWQKWRGDETWNLSMEKRLKAGQEHRGRVLEWERQKQDRNDRMARQAQEVIAGLEPCTGDSPPTEVVGYLLEKGLDREPETFQDGESLVLPYRDDNDEIRTFQKIERDGESEFMEEGELAGNTFLAGRHYRETSVLVLTADYASAQSLAKLLEHPVHCTGCGSNMIQVAEKAHDKDRKRMQLFLADDNRFGRYVAASSSMTTGGVSLFPEFPIGLKPTDELRPEHMTSVGTWHDLVVLGEIGKESAKKQLGELKQVLERIPELEQNLIPGERIHLEQEMMKTKRENELREQSQGVDETRNLTLAKQLFVAEAAKIGLIIEGELVCNDFSEAVACLGDYPGEKSGWYTFDTEGKPGGYLHNDRNGKSTYWNMDRTITQSWDEREGRG